MTDHTELVQRLHEMGNETFDDWDSAHEAADALEAQAQEIERLRADAERLRTDLIACRGTVKAEHHHYERLAMVHGKTPHGECYGNEAQRLSNLLDRIDSLYAIDAARAAMQPNHFPDAGNMVQPSGEVK